jgi:hypothetical protein
MLTLVVDTSALQEVRTAHAGPFHHTRRLTNDPRHIKVASIAMRPDIHRLLDHDDTRLIV